MDDGLDPRFPPQEQYARPQQPAHQDHDPVSRMGGTHLHPASTFHANMNPGMPYGGWQSLPQNMPLPGSTPVPVPGFGPHAPAQPSPQQMQGFVNAFESLRQRELQLQDQLNHLQHAQGYGMPPPLNQYGSHYPPYPTPGPSPAFTAEMHLSASSESIGPRSLPESGPPLGGSCETNFIASRGGPPQPEPVAALIFTHDEFPSIAASRSPGGSDLVLSPGNVDGPAPEHFQNVVTLEDRLRGLIIHNGALPPKGQERGLGRQPSGLAAGQAVDVDSLPPHMRMASEADQRAYLAKKRQKGAQPSTAPAEPETAKTSPGPRKKKLNQMERKKLRAQLNVDLAPGPPPPQGQQRVANPSKSSALPDGRSSHPRPDSQTKGAASGTGASQMRRPGPAPTTPAAGSGWRGRESQQQGRRHPESRVLDPHPRFPPQNRPTFQPAMPRPDPRIAQQQEFFRQRQHFQQIHERQSRYLEDLARVEVPRAAIEPEELERREEFRLSLEDASRRAITEHERIHGHEDFDPATIALKCFGSLSSGFATKASDMDLVLLSPASHPSPCSVLSPIPRILEKAFLDMGHGARLLTKTRVPIIKLCEAPSKELMDGLVQERQKWADGPSASEKQESASEGVPNGTNPGSKAETAVKDAAPNESTAEVDLETFLAEIQRFAQEPEENLWAYYRRAKILMENLGVEDVSTKAGAEGSQRLNRVCEAFVDGISDTDLRSRLRGFKSMNFQNNMRSLAGVWYQAEAERFVRSWETRMILEPTESKEQQGETVVKEWRQLQDKVTPDIVNFNRSLHRYWDRLKILPSAKLGLLSQREEDTPDTYYVRCVTMLRELGGRDYAAAPEQPLDSRERDILEQVLRNYLNGLRDGSIRSRVGHHVITNFVLNGSQMTLKELYAQHNAEHQIMRCWAAKEAGMMSEDDRDIVENYAQQIRANGPRSVDTKLANAFQRLVASLKQKRRQNRDRHVDHLELPKEGVGIQCDVNFSNYLALHNTLLLRCYAHCDPRVRQLVLFVKAWTKRRKINSPYHGSLSSYGYVLMVLHYLVNIAEPAVLPNLQLSWMPPSEQTEQPPKEAMFDGYDVRFWRDEDEIKSLAARGLLTRNRETSGSLLRGFFEYYAGQGPHIVGNGFSWQMDVLSLRTPGGLITKRDKGWTGARTTVTEPTQPGQQRKEVRHRYLFAIEDPFETDHNIARTVTHPGIVAIRDEMRRAWRIINQRGREDNRELDVPGEEGLFDAPVDYEEMAQKTLDAAKAIEVPATGAIATDGAGQQTST